MDKHENSTGALTLSQIFDKCTQLHSDMDKSNLPTCSGEFQEQVKKGIEMLENATHMVNQLQMFSSNEVIEEIATSDLKYLLLPALLGNFTTKVQSSEHAERLERILLAEVYYKDFLWRCKSYELPGIYIPELSYEDDANNQENIPAQSDLANISAAREKKIKQYKMIKEVEGKLGELKTALEKQQDEDIKRNFYMTLLKKWVLTIIEELQSLKMEKTILKNVPKITADDRTVKSKPKSKPLQPVIIVRNELQKKVFGLGYPSAPLMTVDEFYQQRYPEDKSQEQARNQQNSLQQMAADPETVKKQWELEDVEEEERIEKDDPITLQKARAFDDWKDENKRGSGNMKNKG